MFEYIDEMEGQSRTIGDQQENSGIANTIKSWSEFLDMRQDYEENVEKSVLTMDGSNCVAKWKDIMFQRFKEIEETFKEALSASYKERTLNAQLENLKGVYSKVKQIQSNHVQQANELINVIQKIPQKDNFPNEISILNQCIKKYERKKQ